MEDFEIMHPDASTIISQARQIALTKKFELNIYQNKQEQVILTCRMSPFYHPGLYDQACCPFRIRYKMHKEQKEYYLVDYDEMHNHLLIDKPAIMPLPPKHKSLQKFPTPKFDELFSRFECPDSITLKSTLKEVAASVNIGLRHYLYTNDMMIVACSFCIYGKNEADVSELLKSGEISRIRAAMHPSVGIIFRCPFRIVYK